MSETEVLGPSHSLDFEAVGRVVESVRAADTSLGDAYLLPPSRAPSEWYRVQQAREILASDISWAYTLRDVHGDWTSDSRAKRRYEALGRTRRLARELVALIENDDLPLTSSLVPRFHVTDEHGFHVVDFFQLMVGLKRLQAAAEQERAHLRSANMHATAPFRHVVGDPASLATPGKFFISGMGKAFEKGFGQSPSIKFTSDREPAGPFVRFVEAVTREMGEPMSPDGIRKAWERATATGQTSQKN